VIDAFFDRADEIITVRTLIRRSHRWDSLPEPTPMSSHLPA
jgi:hypothetical protein